MLARELGTDLIVLSLRVVSSDVQVLSSFESVSPSESDLSSPGGSPRSCRPPCAGEKSAIAAPF
jgi:hypothetical protein